MFPGADTDEEDVEEEEEGDDDEDDDGDDDDDDDDEDDDDDDDDAPLINPRLGCGSGPSAAHQQLPTSRMLLRGFIQT